jgi:predicted Zn-dependent protease
MKRSALALAFLVAASGPAFAQFGQLGKIQQRAEQVKKIADIAISDEDERKIGEKVSAMLVDRFGVVQDAKLAKYVTLVGTVLAQESSKPKLNWQFVVLDTDGINAYAAPGGIIHITRGALAAIKSEAELAGVLGHEITHITERHTVRTIQRSKAVDVGTDEVGAQGGLAASLVNRMADKAYEMVGENAFGREQEETCDETGAKLANKVGYAPIGLSGFLDTLAARNKGREDKNGLFASHRDTRSRIDHLATIIREQQLKATATGEARYKSMVKVTAKPMTDIAVAPLGAKGVAGSSASNTKPAEEEKKEEPKEKKRGFGLGKIAGSLTSGQQAESTQASASAGGKMVGPDTNAVGGPNKTRISITVTPAEVAEFKKGIV